MTEKTMGADEIAELLRSVSHPDRISLIQKLKDGEMDVNHLADALGIAATRVSQHLAVLRNHSIVEERREGRRHFYHLTEPGLAEWIAKAQEFIALGIF